MKIGIVTLFNAVNYGAFLQAFCLQETVKSLGDGNKVKMIKTSSPLYFKWRMRQLFTYRPSKILFKLKLAIGYICSWRQFDILKTDEKLDLLIVGSDEMWNLKNITVAPLPIFFGEGIIASKKITYAVSCNSTTKEDVDKCDFAKVGVHNFDDISVRDLTTLQSYQPFCRKPIRLDVDPTLLVNLNKYVKPINKTGYILVYTYTFEDYMIKGVVNLAKNQNKKIISVGQKFSWTDENIACDPFEFLGYLKNADFIVTDTFHGTTLSIALEKEFLAYANHKPKVYRVLEQFDLLNRNVSGEVELLSHYKQKIDYESVRSKKANFRTCSLNYLKTYVK